MERINIQKHLLTGLFAALITVVVLRFTEKNDSIVNESSIISLNDESSESNLQENKVECNNIDLTEASTKSVEAVAHITTEFTTEEITYDPILRLFYGEDAYRKRKRHGMSSGSGVVIASNGYIVTNNHVVQDAHTIHVNIGDKKYSAELVGTDPSTDLAVIKINDGDLPYLEFDNSDDLKLGEWVIAVGNPLNLQTTVTAGIVSAKNRNIDLLTNDFDPEKNVFPVESFIQTDAAVNSGNSGGALVNSSGNLVGINTAIASGNGYYTGYSFAIPSNIVKKVAWDIIQYGKVRRVFLGITIHNNNSEVSRELGFQTNKGVVVAGISENGIAAKSTLRKNDLILAIGEDTVSSVAEFQAKLMMYQPGEKLQLEVLRGDRKVDIVVEL